MAELAQPVDDNTARLRLLDAIKTNPGPFTQADMVAGSGLPPHEVDRLLRSIVTDYESTLDVTEEGELIYQFTPGMVARPDVVKADAGRRRRAALKETAKNFFRIWTVVMVVFYTVVYVTLAIAAFVAAQSQNNNNSSRSSRRGGSVFDSLFQYMVFRHWFDSMSYRSHRRHARRVEKRIRKGEDPYRMDRRGTWEHNKKDPTKPGIVERTWYYLFGPEGIERNPLEEEKELLTYVRAKRGIISNADIVALLGVTYDEADRIGTRLCATYAGELDITDDGVAIYRFPELMLTTDEVVSKLDKHITGADPRLDYTWALREKDYSLRKAGGGVIPWLNYFNLILACVTYLKLMPMLGLSGFLWTFVLVIFPGAFSLVFLALGLVRALRELKGRKAYEAENIRLAMYRLLFTRKRAISLPGHEKEIAAAALGSWKPEQLKEHAPLIAEQLRGEAVVKPDGRLEIRVPRIWEEMKAVDKLRRGATPSTPVGRTVFASALPHLDEGPSVETELDEEIARAESEAAQEETAEVLH